MDLTTTTAVKAKLGITGDAGTDAILDGLINEVSQAAEEFLGRHAEVAARTEVYPIAPLQRFLRLRGGPISSVTSVKYASTPVFTDVDALETDVYHIWNARSQIEFLSLAWLPRGYAQVVYTGGMAANTAAFITAFPRIAGAVENEVINRYNRRKKPDGSVVVAGNTAAYEKQLQHLDDLYEALQPHRRIRL